MAFGPIDLIVLEFTGNNFHGETMAYLTELVSSETIRILDLVIVQKDPQNEITVLELDELETSTLQIFDPLRVEVSGMITADDINMIGTQLGNNTTSAIMLFENLWLVNLKQDLIETGGRMVIAEHLNKEVVTEAIEDLAGLV